MPIVSGYRPPGAHHAPKSSRKELILSAPPVPPAGAPSSVPSPGSAAASPPLRIDTRKSWDRANAWLDSNTSATSPVSSEVKRLLNLAMNRWGQPGEAAPLVVKACQLAGLEPVAGDELVAVAPATPAQPATTTPAAPPAPIQPVPAAPASPSPAQPAPAPNPPAQTTTSATITPDPTQPRHASDGAVIVGAIISVGAIGAIAAVGAIVGVIAAVGAIVGAIVGVGVGVVMRMAAHGGTAASVIAGSSVAIAAIVGVIAGIVGVSVGVLIAVGVGAIVGVGVLIAVGIIADKAQCPQH